MIKSSESSSQSLSLSKIISLWFIFDSYRKKFKHDDYGEEWFGQIVKHNSILDFDNFVRSKILGYNSVHTLYRNVSW